MKLSELTKDQLDNLKRVYKDPRHYQEVFCEKILTQDERSHRLVGMDETLKVLFEDADEFMTERMKYRHSDV